jgi:AraC-like DNA-binding protein
MTHARLPAAPLRRVLLRLRDAESLTWDELADRAGLSTRHLFRLLASRTVSELAADRVSCRIGLHPALVWPKEWFGQEHHRRSGHPRTEEAV